MDRIIVNPGQIPRDVDNLSAQKNAYLAISALAQALSGTADSVRGLVVTAGAGMSVNIGPGQYYSYQTVDASAYGSLGADTRQVVKQGLQWASINLPLPAISPAPTAGQSVQLLLQASFSETDGGAVVLPYYNVSNPNVAFSGPNGSNAAQNTLRSDGIAYTFKQGAAYTGTAPALTADNGCIALAVITLTATTTALASSNIAAYPGANILKQSLASVTPTVLDFGADPSGLTDSTAAFLACAQSCGVVQVPAGTFLVRDLNLPAGTQLVGLDRSRSILTQISGETVAAGAYMHAVISINANDGGSSDVSANTSDIRIRNLTLQGTVASDGYSEHVYLVFASAVTRLSIDDCNLLGFRGDAIYLGSGDSGTAERHNQNVRISNCLIDGINQQNRNGVSVIDCDGLEISGCTVQNTTNNISPGAIDLEPNPNSYHVLQNVWIHHNHFHNIGLSFSGAVCINIPGATTFTTPLQNVRIHHNTFQNVVMPFSFNHTVSGGISSSSTEPDRGIYFEDNDILAPGANYSTRPFIAYGLRGGRIRNNTFRGTHGALLGYNNAGDTVDYQNLDIKICDNQFVQCGSVEGITIHFYTNGYVEIADNHFTDCGNGAAGSDTIQFESGTSSFNVNLLRNTWGGTLAKATSAVANVSNGHSFTAVGNRCDGNDFAGLTQAFQAYLTDDCGTVTNLFDGNTPPTAFPIGVSIAAINGDPADKNCPGNSYNMTPAKWNAYNHRGAWVTGTVYAVNDVVNQAGVAYICQIAHTSGTFATDLAAGDWVISNLWTQGILTTRRRVLSATLGYGFIEQEFFARRIASGADNVERWARKSMSSKSPDDSWTPWANTSAASALAVKTVSANYVMTFYDRVLLVNPGTGGVIITLPAAAGWFDDQTPLLVIKNISASVALTVSRAGSDSIDGNPTQSLAAGAVMRLTSNGNNEWFQM